MNIQGNWNGTIILGEGYNEDSGAEICFSLDIVQEAEQIWGTAMDTGGVYNNPYPARIKGTLTDRTIAFVKQYDVLHFSDKDGLHVEPSRKGLFIHYSGQFYEAEQIFRGTWIARGRRMLIGEGEARKEYHFGAHGGSWNMRRK